MLSLAQIWIERRTFPQWAQRPSQGFNIDSRTIQEGQIFVALCGSSSAEQVQQYAQEAIERGAIGVLSEIPLVDIGDVVVEPQLRQILGVLQQRFLQSEEVVELPRLCAVTGTNGKTTVSRLISEILTLLGVKAAVMGTTGNGVLPVVEPSTHTTLDALQLQKKIYQFAEQGASFASIEASSHGLEQGRLHGCEVEVAVFTNLTRDHLDYHKTLEQYQEAKGILFQFGSLQKAIINYDDGENRYFEQVFLQNHHAQKCWRYSLYSDQADFYASALNYDLDGVKFFLNTPFGYTHVESPFLGRFNVSNLIAAIATVCAFGFELADIVRVIPQLNGAPGRMQTLPHAERLFVVDYAHTPDALAQVLSGLKAHTKHKLWVVFGCGGDRDRGKRSLMLQAAIDRADYVMVTSDNPRNESMDQIVMDMQQGIRHRDSVIMMMNPDRRAAIRFAVDTAEPGDIVIIAGKGHENYQEINGVRHWFDDVIELKSALAQAKLPQHVDAVSSSADHQSSEG